MRVNSAITRNTRQRRGSKATTNVPVYFDTFTPRPFHDSTIPLNERIYPEDRGKFVSFKLTANLLTLNIEAQKGVAAPDHIHLDATGFGASCCCLQVTFQAPDVLSARSVYDALVPVAPILVSPAFFKVEKILKLRVWFRWL